jgi:hypothetical protein
MTLIADALLHVTLVPEWDDRLRAEANLDRFKFNLPWEAESIVWRRMLDERAKAERPQALHQINLAERVRGDEVSYFIETLMQGLKKAAGDGWLLRWIYFEDVSDVTNVIRNLTIEAFPRMVATTKPPS